MYDLFKNVPVLFHFDEMFYFWKLQQNFPFDTFYLLCLKKVGFGGKEHILYLTLHFYPSFYKNLFYISFLVIGYMAVLESII